VTRIMYRLRRLLRATGPRGAGRSRPQRDKGLTPADVARILNNERFRGKKGGGGGSRGSRGGGLDVTSSHGNFFDNRRTHRRPERTCPACGRILPDNDTPSAVRCAHCASILSFDPSTGDYRTTPLRRYE